MSLRNEIISFISIIAYTIHSLNREVQQLPMLQKDNSDPHNCEFEPLSNAANGEEVDPIELKNSLAKAIKITQEKLNSSGPNRRNTVRRKSCTFSRLGET